MATETPCQTPRAQFTTTIHDRGVSVSVAGPRGCLHLDESSARQLEADLHNAVELALARWWVSID